VSQDFLAKKLGFTQKAYSKIENNETKLNVEVLQRVSEILEVPIESFFNNSLNSKDDVINSKIQEIETLKMVIKKFEELTDKK